MRGTAALLLLLSAGCAAGQAVDPDAAAADGAVPDAPPEPSPDAAPVTPGFFVDDEVADFAAGTLDHAVIEPFGAVAPVAHYTGGLRVRAADAGFFTDATVATWAQVQAMTFTTPIAPTGSFSMVWGAGTPAGLGLLAGDDFTLAHEGEIYLEAGAWTFYLLADDHAFLEIAPLGIPSFSRVASANWPTEASGVYAAATSGWYQIRLAYVERTAGAQLRVQLAGPSQPRATLSRHRVRFAVGAMDGLDAAGFDDSRLLGDRQATFDRVAPAGKTWNTGWPAELGITGADTFSVRWAGQLRIEDAGAYSFRYVSDDGQRLWIDGALVLDFWDDAPHDQTTPPIPLDRGWHDLVVDHSEATGSAQAFVGVADGPDLVGAVLPVDHLRPVVARGERYDTGVDRADRAIPDNGQVESSIVIDAPPGAKAFGVDVGWTLEHGYHPDLEISLIAPDASVIVLRDNVDGAGSITERLHTVMLDDATASGTWRLRVADTVSLDTGTLRDFQLTVHHRDGEPPIEPAATFESTVRDLGEGITEYQALSWRARLAPGSAVRLLVRTGDTAELLAIEPWSDPIVDPGAGVPPVVARRYFQYRIELASDGDGSALVDWVRLDHANVEVP